MCITCHCLLPTNADGETGEGCWGKDDAELNTCGLPSSGFRYRRSSPWSSRWKWFVCKTTVTFTHQWSIGQNKLFTGENKLFTGQNKLFTDQNKLFVRRNIWHGDLWLREIFDKEVKRNIWHCWSLVREIMTYTVRYRKRIIYIWNDGHWLRQIFDMMVCLAGPAALEVGTTALFHALFQLPIVTRTEMFQLSS